MNSIFRRRSVRRFRQQPVPDELLEKILRAGMAAPSAGNEQPWHFIVIRSRQILDEIPRFHPFARMLAASDHGADCAIAVCGDTALERYAGYWVQDCSAATENMLLEAQELGLGGVWLGVYPMADRVESLKALLRLPETVVPLNLVALGYPVDVREPEDRFDPTRIHQDVW